MNLERWEERFYYTNTPDPIEHCILLFEGLKPYNLWIHWITKYDNSPRIYAFPEAKRLNDDKFIFDINSSHCWIDLSLYHMEYMHWIRIGDPLPMIDALKRKQNEMTAMQRCLAMSDSDAVNNFNYGSGT